ncbi:MAG TPA: hypothetical protein VG099_23595, partial [Gemmataceae bacterium]|nr:hypothetical protein [Gemmataceae bacterium]
LPRPAGPRVDPGEQPSLASAVLAAPESSDLLEIRDESGARAAILDVHSLGPQAFRLFFEGGGRSREHNASARAEHTMPREVDLFRGHLERETGQPCAAGEAGGACNRSIC